MLTENNAPIVLLCDTLSLFLVLYKDSSYLKKILKSGVPSALKTRLIQQLLFQVLKLLRDVQKNYIFFSITVLIYEQMFNSPKYT